MVNNMVVGAVECPVDPNKYTVRYFGSLWDEYSLPEEYPERLKALGSTDHVTFSKVPQPVWIEGNAYSGYAKPFRAEKNPILAEGMSALVEQENGAWVLTLDVPACVTDANCDAVTTERLGSPIYAEERYEDPDGSAVDFTRDFFGEVRQGNVIPGPFARLMAGKQKIIIWKE